MKRKRVSQEVYQQQRREQRGKAAESVQRFLPASSVDLTSLSSKEKERLYNRFLENYPDQFLVQCIKDSVAISCRHSQEQVLEKVVQTLDRLRTCDAHRAVRKDRAMPLSIVDPSRAIC